MKTKSFIIVLVTMLLWLTLSPAMGFAQSEEPPATTPIDADAEALPVLLQGENVYAFSDLGYSDEIMNGPYDYLRYRFHLPETWVLNNGTSLQLKIRNTVSSTSSISESELVAATGATLDVNFNSVWVTTLVLDWSGERIVSIPIPAKALSLETGQYTLSLYLDAGIDCLFDHQTTVLVSAESVIDLQHTLIPPKIDLTQFPRPIYQNNSLASNTVTSKDTVSALVLVTPDQPSQGELQAALTLSAGFGYLTGGNMPVNMIPVSSLTEEMRSTSSLFFVGKGADFDILSQATLPAAFSGTKFNAPDAQPEDGVIQAAISPWNPMKVLAVISSETDAGMVKAAQAASSGVIRVGNRLDLAIVSEITQKELNETVPVDRTLADLGYASLQMGGMRYNPVDYLDVLFYVPAGQTVDGEAYIDVVFNNSSMLNLEQSGLSILLNGNTIGGVAYTWESAEKITSQKIPIPGFLLRPGMNLLTVQANNHPLDYCSDFNYDNAWTTLYDQTLIHLPLKPAETKEVSFPTLGNMTDFLTASPNLETVTFVVAPNSPAALSAASSIAYDLGVQVIGEMVQLKAAFADQTLDDFRQDQEVVLVGKPSELPMIAELGEQLPAPFEDGSNVANESIFRVIYRLPAGTSLGYLELVESPWTTGRNILAVLGSTDAGVLDSANAMTNSVLRNQLAGNFAVVRGEQIITSDTRYGIGTGNISATLVPEATPEVQNMGGTNPVVPAEVPMANQTGWILPVVAVLSVLIVLILLVVFITYRKKR